MAQARVPVIFAVSRYLTYNYFNVAWRYGPPRDFSQSQFLERLHLRYHCFLILAVDILETNILT